MFVPKMPSKTGPGRREPLETDRFAVGAEPRLSRPQIRPRNNCVLRLVDRGRNDPEIFSEDAAEMRRTRKAPRKCDVGDCLSALGLQLLAAVLQPRLPDVVADGHAPVAEQHVQIALGAAQRRRNLVDAEIRIAQMLADEGLSPDIHRLGTAPIERRIGLAKRQQQQVDQRIGDADRRCSATAWSLRRTRHARNHRRSGRCRCAPKVCTPTSSPNGSRVPATVPLAR